MASRPDPNNLASRIEGELALQRRALIEGDWRGLAESSGRQEAMLEELARWQVGAGQVELVRRLRRGADRNARLALRLRESIERRFRGGARSATYNRRGHLSTGAASLLDRRG